MFFNTFHVAPEDVDAFMEAWTIDGEFMKEQPGLISIQLHRAIGGSATFLNVAAWESGAVFRAAASSPEGQASLSQAGYIALPDEFKQRLLSSVEAIA